MLIWMIYGWKEFEVLLNIIKFDEVIFKYFFLFILRFYGLDIGIRLVFLDYF